MSERPRRRPADGDSGRWAVYDEHHAAVRRYVARRVEPSAVDDLTAETFAVAWRRLPRESDEPLPWLYAVARKVVHGHRRSTARRSALARKVGHVGPDRTDAGDPHDRLAGDPVLADAFATLTAKEREALALVAWEGLEHPAAARVAGCSSGTFAVRLTRARAKLRSALEAAEDADGDRRGAAPPDVGTTTATAARPSRAGWSSDGAAGRSPTAPGGADRGSPTATDAAVRRSPTATRRSPTGPAAARRSTPTPTTTPEP